VVLCDSGTTEIKLLRILMTARIAGVQLARITGVQLDREGGGR
jgi:hypothetical protein